MCPEAQAKRRCIPLPLILPTPSGTRQQVTPQGLHRDACLKTQRDESLSLRTRQRPSLDSVMFPDPEPATTPTARRGVETVGHERELFGQLVAPGSVPERVPGIAPEIVRFQHACGPPHRGSAHRGRLRLGRHAGLVLLVPRREVAALEGRVVVHRHGQFDLAAGADAKPQAGVGVAAAGEDEHHRPVAAAEAAVERLFIGGAGMGLSPGCVWHQMRSTCSGR